MRLLLIEDELDIINFLKPRLEAENFIVDSTQDAETGSFQARTCYYDIIILDLMLSVKNGYTVCNEIRQSGRSVPILILSAIHDSEQKTKLLNCGADDYLSKPFYFNELLARIHALLRRPAQTTKNIYKIGDIVLNSHEQQIIKAGKEIYLTKKEFLLLEYLLKNQGIALTRHMIMEHVWDINADPFSHTIESHILSLRKKVDPTERYIKTIPGVGYKAIER